MASTGMSCSLLMTCRLLLPRFFVPSSGCLHSRKSQTLTARDNQPERSCHTSANHVRCAARPQSTSTSSTPEISSSFESVDCESSSSPRSTHYEIAGRTHECDDWSNLTPTVQRLIGRALHRLHNNPLRLLTDGLCHHFHDYTRFEFPDPVVTTHDNFDSLLIAPNHVSRSRSDTYYVNKGHLLRSHTSAHQAHCLAQLGPDQDRFVSIADVYRRDVIDSTHYPAFHQCELFRIYDQDQVHLCIAFNHYTNNIIFFFVISNLQFDLLFFHFRSIATARGKIVRSPRWRPTHRAKASGVFVGCNKLCRATTETND